MSSASLQQFSACNRLLLKAGATLFIILAVFVACLGFGWERGVPQVAFMLGIAGPMVLAIAYCSNQVAVVTALIAFLSPALVGLSMCY